MSLSFYPARFDETTCRYDCIAGLDNLNVGSRNAGDIARALHLAVDQEGIDVTPIETGIARCVAFLRNHVGKPDPQLEGFDDQTPGKARWVEPDRDAGYLQARIAALLTLLREGAARGATHFYAA